MSNFAQNTWFEVINPGCGCAYFAMNLDHYRDRVADHKSWYCPTCGSCRHFTGKSEDRKKLEAAEEALAQTKRESQEYAARAIRAERQSSEVNKQYVKIRNRVRKGMCPCCNETFPSLAQHMQRVHPEFGGPDLLRSLREAFGLTQAALGKEIGGIAAAAISNYETGKSVASYSKRMIESWLSRQVTGA